MLERLKQARKRLEAEEEKKFSPYACLSPRALRRQPDSIADTGFRLNFAVDSDRILHSLAYTRYIDKTQVFSLMDNEHITHRALHVQLVSKIARTAGLFLGLNLDLLEAIALAHDIGHPPFGHEGESFLDEKCLEHGLGHFQHNLQGVHFLEKVEAKGRGLNLSLQVLDGVLGHDGEALIENLRPGGEKDFCALDEEIGLKSQNPEYMVYPFTLEGCVVRLADSLAYVGRDMEDAILVGLIERRDLPLRVVEVLGSTNGTIVHRLVEDMIAASLNQPWLGFSLPVRQALLELKQFNYQRIYKNPLICGQHQKIKELFVRLFDSLLQDLREQRLSSPIYKDFLNNLDQSYLEQSSRPMMVRDFIASMTDEYFLNLAEALVRPRRLPKRFA